MLTTLAGGQEMFEFSNGQREKHFPDGRKEILFPDGTLKNIYKNKEEESIFPDGTVQRIFVDGTRVIEFTNGLKETISPKGSKVRPVARTFRSANACIEHTRLLELFSCLQRTSTQHSHQPMHASNTKLPGSNTYDHQPTHRSAPSGPKTTNSASRALK